MTSRRRQRPEPYDGPYLTGIDLSHWQGPNVDFDRVAKWGAKFVISREGDGKDPDHTFRRNWKETRRAGMRRGAYLFFRADRDGKTQAERMLRRLEELDIDSSDLIPWVDVERKSGKNLPGGIWEGPGDKLPSRLVLTETLECCHVLENELGRPPGLYGGEFVHWIMSQANPDFGPDFARFPIWVPSYDKNVPPFAPRMPSRDGEPWPWTEWTIHQHSSTGKVDGVVGPCDVNVYRGVSLLPLTLGWEPPESGNGTTPPTPGPQPCCTCPRCCCRCECPCRPSQP